MNWIARIQTMPAFQTFLGLWHRLRLFVPMLQVQAMPASPPFLALDTKIT